MPSMRVWCAHRRGQMFGGLKQHSWIGGALANSPSCYFVGFVPNLYRRRSSSTSACTSYVEETDQMLTGLRDLLRHTRATAIVGDLLKGRARDSRLRDMGPRATTHATQSVSQSITL